MQKSENIGLNLFEAKDNFSREAFNGNWSLLDTLLKNAGDAIAKRIKFATGSYVGQAANKEDYFSDYADQRFSTALGIPISQTTDKVIATVDFQPKAVILSGTRLSQYAWYPSVWNGQTHTNINCTGQERQSFLLLFAEGMPLSPCWYSQVSPNIARTYTVDTSGLQVWVMAFSETKKTPSCVNDSKHYYSGQSWVDAIAQIDIVESNGKYTITAKGANPVFGTENLTDIGGLTYHWLALGV